MLGALVALQGVGERVFCWGISKEMFAKFNNILVKIVIAGAYSSYSQELAILDAVLASLWMRRIIYQVVVRVSGFCEQGCADFVFL